MHCDCQARQGLHGNRGVLILSQQAVAQMGAMLRFRETRICASHLHCTMICGRDPLLPEGGRAAGGRVLGMLLLASEKDLAEADTRCDSVMPVQPEFGQ